MIRQLNEAPAATGPAYSKGVSVTTRGMRRIPNIGYGRGRRFTMSAAVRTPTAATLPASCTAWLSGSPLLLDAGAGVGRDCARGVAAAFRFGAAARVVRFADAGLGDAA